MRMLAIRNQWRARKPEVQEQGAAAGAAESMNFSAFLQKVLYIKIIEDSS